MREISVTTVCAIILLLTASLLLSSCDDLVYGEFIIHSTDLPAASPPKIKGAFVNINLGNDAKLVGKFEYCLFSRGEESFAHPETKPYPIPAPGVQPVELSVPFPSGLSGGFHPLDVVRAAWKLTYTDEDGNAKVSEQSSEHMIGIPFISLIPQHGPDECHCDKTEYLYLGKELSIVIGFDANMGRDIPVTITVKSPNSNLSAGADPNNDSSWKPVPKSKTIGETILSGRNSLTYVLKTRETGGGVQCDRIQESSLYPITVYATIEHSCSAERSSVLEAQIKGIGKRWECLR